MSDDLITDDSSHYEISLTAGQAFIAFVLLLFSLAAAFAFGLIIGRGQGDDRLVVRREPAVISEGTAPEDSRIVELDQERAPMDPQPNEVPVVLEDDSPRPATETGGESPARPPSETSAPPATAPPAQPPAEQPPRSEPSGPVFAQVLSSTEARAAENLAARLIESGFNTAYVERVATPNGMIYRVRVRFPSEEEARGAAARLRAITGSEPWITRQ